MAAVADRKLELSLIELHVSVHMEGSGVWRRGSRGGGGVTWGADGGLRRRSAGWTSEPRRSLLLFFYSK